MYIRRCSLLASATASALMVGFLLAGCGAGGAAETQRPLRVDAESATEPQAAPAAGSPEAERVAQPPAELTVGVGSLTVGTSPSTLGVELGFFQQEGLNVSLHRIDNAPLVAGVFAGTLDLGQVNPWSALPLVAQGAPLRVVASVVGGTSYSIVAQPEIMSVEQLRGTQIALGDPTAGSTAIGIFALEKAGLPPGQYENMTRSTTTAQKAALMEQNLIQAAILTAPTSNQFMDMGYTNVLNTWEYVPLYANDYITVTDGWARQHEDVLVRLLKAVVRSLRWVNDPANREEFVERVAPIVRQDPRWVREGWQIYQGNNLWPRNAEGSTEALQFAADYLDQLQVLEGSKPRVDQFYNESYLRRALAELIR